MKMFINVYKHTLNEIINNKIKINIIKFLKAIYINRRVNIFNASCMNLISVKILTLSIHCVQVHFYFICNLVLVQL